MSSTYYVKKEGRGCEHCGHGILWNVIGPDGMAHSITWTEERDAQDFAEAMNEAYEKGREQGHIELNSQRRAELEHDYRRELRKDAEMPEQIEVIRIVPVVLKPPTSEMMTLVDVQRACDGRSKLLRITVS